MATVVNLPGDKRADVIGQAIGGGLGAFLTARGEKKEEEERKKRLAALMQAIAGAETGDDVRAVIPGFSDILTEPSDFQFIMELAQKKDEKDDEREKITGFGPEGVERPFFLTKQEFSRMAGGETLEDIRPIGGVGFTATKPKEGDEATKFKIGRETPTGFKLRTEAPLSEREPGEVTLTELDERRKAAEAERKALEATGASLVGSDKEFIVNATAELENRGMEVTDENIRKASQINSVANNLSSRLATGFGLDTADIITAKLRGDEDGKRFIVGSSLIKDLLFAGFTSGRALAAARRAAVLAVPKPKDKSPPQPAGDIIKNDAGNFVKADPAQVLGAAVVGKAFVASDRGKIFKQPNGTFVIYIGTDTKGEPIVIEVIQ